MYSNVYGDMIPYNNCSNTKLSLFREQERLGTDNNFRLVEIFVG